MTGLCVLTTIFFCFTPKPTPQIEDAVGPVYSGVEVENIEMDEAGQPLNKTRSLLHSKEFRQSELNSVLDKKDTDISTG